jgi:uncharacterized protein
MVWRIASKAIDFAFSSENVKIGAIGIFGGESLMEWRLVERIVVYAEKKYKVKKFDIATNGLLLTKKRLEYFVRHNISPSISIDGIKEAQDANRVTSDGQGSFDKLKGKLALLATYCKLLRKIEIIISISPETVEYLSESINYLVGQGFYGKNVRFNLRPAISAENNWNSEATLEFEKQLFFIGDTFIRNYKKKKYLNISPHEDQPADYYLLKAAKLKDNLSCKAGEELLGVGIDGKMYPCYAFASCNEGGKEAFCLGNVSIGTIQRALKRADFFKKQNNKCLSCHFWNWSKGGSFNEPLEVYHEFYKAWIKVSKYVIKNIKC